MSLAGRLAGPQAGTLVGMCVTMLPFNGCCQLTLPVCHPYRLQRQFEDALRGCLEAKRLPFNCSFINDRMKRQDSRWNVQSQLGESPAVGRPAAVWLVGCTIAW